MKKILVSLTPLLLLSACSEYLSLTAAKKRYIPANIWNVPANNDYNNNNSLYSYQRMAETADFAAFWAKDFGSTPATNTDPNKRFDINAILVECERFYKFYADTLKFVTKGQSVSDSLKALIYVTNSTDGTAYGGGAEDKVGILWVTPPRINTAPYGAVAHELGHVFQYFVHADGHWGYTSAPAGSNGQTIFEMTSQYMLFQVYPNWMTFENYHLQAFMQHTNYAFLHEISQYDSPFVLEYWSGKHGKDFVGKLWRSAVKGEDPVATYKRLNALTQPAFNDEMFDAYRRFVTWDLPRISSVAKIYANQHISTLHATTDGYYIIANSACPQNYGYNAIKLDVPAAGTTVQLQFRGLAGQAGYRAIQTDKAGWRYGFLAVKNDGTRTYGDIYRDSVGQVSFTVPANTAYLWLVVSGAPTAHWEHLSDGNDANDEQWPYKIKLTGTTINSAFIK